MNNKINFYIFKKIRISKKFFGSQSRIYNYLNINEKASISENPKKTKEKKHLPKMKKYILKYKLKS